MTINDILNSDLSDSQKISMIKILKNGGESSLDGKYDSNRDRIIDLLERVIKPAAEVGNPTARRLLGLDKSYYTFTSLDGSGLQPGSKGNVFIGSYDNYITPSIMENPKTGKLIFIKNPWKDAKDLAMDQSIKFDTPEDARFFGDHYHNYPDLFPCLLDKTYKMALIEPLPTDAIKIRKEGGDLPEPDTEISIAGKTYKVCVAKTEEEKEIGLSKCKELPEDGGMLFVYEEPQEDLWFTMEDTSIDLDIIFLDEEGVVTTVNSCKAFDPNPIPDRVGNALYVLEVNINSGIRPGDEIEEYSDDDELTKEEKEEAVKRSRMLVLDENGDVQMKLEGGERIFSRISTRKFIKAALKAYKSDKDLDYIKVGKLVFKELNAQDDRKPEYVEKS